jgi:hypothetical protein
MLTFGPGTQGSAVMSEVGWLDSLLRTLYGGLDPSIPGMGGRDCALHIPFRVKVFEAIAVIVYLGILYVWTAKTLTSVTEDDVRVMKERDQRLGGKMKKVVLMMLSLVFGMELSFKIITGRLLFVLNPCHAITLSQVLRFLSVVRLCLRLSVGLSACLSGWLSVCVCLSVCLCVSLIADD